MSRTKTRMHNANKFKLGLFCTNAIGGLAMTKVPERWDATWENNLRCTQMAEAAGLEFTLPIARWHGYRGETDTQGTSLETLTWASGLLAATSEITVFGTVHVPLISPVFAAKQVVTADHIGRGRFGLNIVSGWNAGEFGMFGIELREHDERYDFSEEWLTIAKRIWSEREPFDFKGKYFDLTGVVSNPKPFGGNQPLVMSAGSSKAGRAFAARHVDCLFMVIVDFDTLADEIAAIKTLDAGRQIGFYSSGHMVCRRTQKEAEDYYNYYVHEMGDWDAVEHIVRIRQQGQSVPADHLATIKERFVSGVGTYPVVGSADTCAETFRKLSEAGLDGMAFGLVNFIDEIPFVRDELLPRMERLGLREAAAAAA